MITNDNLLWNIDEYQAAVDYKGEGYNFINVLLSDDVTIRERKGKLKYFPKTQEEFKTSLKRIVDLYSAIKKNYILNGDTLRNKSLYRGGRTGKNNMSFLSTSDSLMTALEFVKDATNEKSQALLMMTDYQNIPCAHINKLVPEAWGFPEESEILFLPSEIGSSEDMRFEECLEMSKQQGEQITEYDKLLEKYSLLKCKKVTLREPDYSKEKTTLSEEDLAEMFTKYQQNVQQIRTLDKNSEEYNKAYQKILKFKKECQTWIHQKFYEINLSIDNQQDAKSNDIQISSEYDSEEIFIGNTGEMYYVHDNTNGEEYYFKPAVLKNGTPRSYRAYIQEAAYSIQQIINPENAIKCNTIELDGRFGAIQEKIPIDRERTKDFKRYFDCGEGELSPKIIRQIMAEYLVDFCLCNYDSNSKNFVIDENGNLRGVDKEQSFRYINEDKDNNMMFSTNYNENYGENPPIYNLLFEKIKSGEMSIKYFDEMRYRASRLAQYPDKQYRQIFEKYAYTKSKTPEDAEKLLSGILERKKDILQRVEQLHHEVFQEWFKNKEAKKKASKVEKSDEKKTISMKAVVLNAITQGITTEDITKCDNVEHEKSQIYILKGVTKDD